MSQVNLLFMYGQISFDSQFDLDQSSKKIPKKLKVADDIGKLSNDAIFGYIPPIINSKPTNSLLPINDYLKTSHTPIHSNDIHESNEPKLRNTLNIIESSQTLMFVEKISCSTNSRRLNNIQPLSLTDIFSLLKESFGNECILNFCETLVNKKNEYQKRSTDIIPVDSKPKRLGITSQPYASSASSEDLSSALFQHRQSMDTKLANLVDNLLHQGNILHGNIPFSISSSQQIQPYISNSHVLSNSSAAAKTSIGIPGFSDTTITASGMATTLKQALDANKDLKERISYLESILEQVKHHRASLNQCHNCNQIQNSTSNTPVIADDLRKCQELSGDTITVQHDDRSPNKQQLWALLDSILPEKLHP